MNFFLRIVAALSLSALLTLFLFLAISLILQSSMPPSLAELASVKNITVFAVSLFLLFLLILFSPALRDLSSEPKKGCVNCKKRSAKEEAIAADFIAQAVSRAVEQAVVSYVPQASAALGTASKGHYVYNAKGGFEGLLFAKSAALKEMGLESVTNRDGIFVIDPKVSSSYMEDESDIDREFKSLVDSVLT